MLRASGSNEGQDAGNIELRLLDVTYQGNLIVHLLNPEHSYKVMQKMKMLFFNCVACATGRTRHVLGRLSQIQPREKSFTPVVFG